MKTPVYLDNNATTPLDPRALEEMLPALKEQFGNPASTTHQYGWYAAELVKIARERVAALVAARPEEIVFTSGATESINTVLASFTGRGRIVTGATEHKATLDPLERLKSNGADVVVLPVGPDGSIDLAALDAACVPGTSLVSFTLANNEIGTVHPIAEISRAVKPRGILVHCDAAQAAGKLPLNVSSLGADFISFSAHKIYGPKGAGALFVSREHRSALEPLLLGGGHEGGLRSGTLNVPAIVGFGRAAELAANELEKEAERLRTLAGRFWSALRLGLPAVRLNGPQTGRLPGNLNFVIPGVENARLVGLVQSKVALSVGSACQSASRVPSHVLQAIGLQPGDQRSSMRVGIGRFNTEEEIDFAAVAIIEAARKSV